VLWWGDLRLLRPHAGQGPRACRGPRVTLAGCRRRWRGRTNQDMWLLAVRQRCQAAVAPGCRRCAQQPFDGRAAREAQPWHGLSPSKPSPGGVGGPVELQGSLRQPWGLQVEGSGTVAQARMERSITSCKRRTQDSGAAASLPRLQMLSVDRNTSGKDPSRPLAPRLHD
jgi:hypothetical protein